MARDFPLADILSITTGRLLSHDHIAGVYRILNHMTGDDLFTHQLGRAAEACRPALIARHPQLANVTPAEDLDAPDLLAWLTVQEGIHGDTLPVTPIAGWHHIDPIEEICGIAGPEKVIVVALPDAN